MNWTAERNDKGVFPVFGRRDDSRVKEKTQANKSTLKNKEFLWACKEAGIEPTKRQASKWNNKRGKAYNYRRKV